MQGAHKRALSSSRLSGSTERFGSTVAFALQYSIMAAVLPVRSNFRSLPVPDCIQVGKAATTPWVLFLVLDLLFGGSESSASTAAALAFNISVRSLTKKWRDYRTEGGTR